MVQTDSLIASAAQGNPSALRGLAAASLRVDPRVWQQALPEAAAAVLLAMQHVDWAAREAAAGALRDVAVSHAHLLPPFLPRILIALVDACADDIREVTSPSISLKTSVLSSVLHVSILRKSNCNTDTR